MSVEFSSERDYEEIVKKCVNTAYRFCNGRMCEAEDKVLFPNVKFVDDLIYPRHSSKFELIEFPTENTCYDIFTTLEKAVHETAHHFEHVLSNHHDEDQELSKNIEYIKSNLKPEEIKELVKQLDKEIERLNKKEGDKRRKWVEGTAYRIQERFLSDVLKRIPSNDSIIMKHLSKSPRVRNPEKYIFSDLMPEPSIDFLKREIEGGLNLANHTYKNPDILTKILFISDQFNYMKNAREGWLVVRKLPELQFKKLLKDREAHNKIDWSLNQC